MKEQVHNSPQENKKENDNVLSLEKKLQAKEKEDENPAKQFGRQFFEYYDNITPIEDGLKIKSKKEIDPELDRANMQAAGLSATIEELEKNLDEAERQGMDPDSVVHVRESLQRAEDQYQEKLKEVEKIMDKKEEFEKRADAFEQRGIYGE